MGVLFPKTYKYKSFSNGELENGRYSDSFASTVDFTGNIQPASEREINALNIGRQTNGMIKIITDIDFNVSYEGTNINSDIILYDNKEWEVIKKDNHNSDGILPHKTYFAELRIRQ